jgi:protein pelota
LLVTDKLLRTQTCAEILDIAKNMNAKVAIISTANEAGEKLESLGGIAAILRYKFEDSI